MAAAFQTAEGEVPTCLERNVPNVEGNDFYFIL